MSVVNEDVIGQLAANTQYRRKMILWGWTYPGTIIVWAALLIAYLAKHVIQ
jgi:hypothetical protein